MSVVHGKCDRARQWASLELDGELSAFERALLENHIAGCASCADFRAEIGGLTTALRIAPYEPIEGGVVLGHIRRRVRLRLAPAVAAMSVAAVGLGSVLAAASFQGGPVAHFAAQSVVNVSPSEANAARIPEAMNLSASRALRSLHDRTATRIRSRSSGPLRGGPAVRR